MRKLFYIQNKNVIFEIGIDSLRRRVFVYLGSDLYGTQSREDNVWAGLHFLCSRINPEQRIETYTIACKPHENLPPLTLTFSSVIGTRAPISNHHCRGERDTHSIFAAAWRFTRGKSRLRFAYSEYITRSEEYKKSLA